MKSPAFSNTNSIIRRKRAPEGTPYYRFPSVTIFMSFDPKTGAKNKIHFALANAMREASSQLRTKYPCEMSELVIEKLKVLVSGLNFSTHKKSLAIFVSPVFEKVYYLNFGMNETVMVNQSLQISDLVNAKSQRYPFHAVLLNEKNSKIFLKGEQSFIDITFEGFIGKLQSEPTAIVTPQAVSHTESGPDDVARFLHHIDQTLGLVLMRDKLPVVLFGKAELIGQFEKITCHSEYIAQRVSEDFLNYSSEVLKEVFNSELVNHKHIRERNLLNRLTEARLNNQLITGAERVSDEIRRHRGQLLLMEKGFRERLVSTTYMNNTLPDRKYNKFSNVKTETDEMMEKIFAAGGNVEIVTDGFLKEHGPVALVMM